jgi:hypothetical protein
VRALTLLAAIAALMSVIASPALAGSETFMSNAGLSAGNANASTAAHSGFLAVSGNSDHTFCPGFGTGYAGYTSTPFTSGHSTLLDVDCGPGTQGWSYDAGGSFMHGAVYNPNASTTDTFTYAYFGW